MKATKSLKLSLTQIKYLTILIFLGIGAATAFNFWPQDYYSENVEHWKSFAVTMSGVSATMVGFLSAVGALLYTVSNTGLVIYIRQQGIERRILIDLFAATLIWLIVLFFSIFANFPKSNISPVTSGMLSFGFGVSGLLSFLPIGYSLWVILSNLNTPKSGETDIKIPPEEWHAPTDLD